MVLSEFNVHCHKETLSKLLLPEGHFPYHRLNQAVLIGQSLVTEREAGHPAATAKLQCCCRAWTRAGFAWNLHFAHDCCSSRHTI